MTWHKLILLYTTLNPPGPIFYFWNSNHKCLRFTINNYLWNLANWVGHNNASASAWRGMIVLTFFELAKTIIPLQSLTTEMIENLLPMAASQLNLNHCLLDLDRVEGTLVGCLRRMVSLRGVWFAWNYLHSNVILEAFGLQWCDINVMHITLMWHH